MSYRPEIFLMCARPFSKMARSSRRDRCLSPLKGHSTGLLHEQVPLSLPNFAAILQRKSRSLMSYARQDSHLRSLRCRRSVLLLNYARKFEAAPPQCLCDGKSSGETRHIRRARDP